MLHWALLSFLYSLKKVFKKFVFIDSSTSRCIEFPKTRTKLPVAFYAFVYNIYRRLH